MSSLVKLLVIDLLQTAIAFEEMKLSDQRRSDELELLTELGHDEESVPVLAGAL